MSNPDDLDRELREYLQQEPNLSRGDRLAYLKVIVNKHLEFNKLDHVVNSFDMYGIISGAKQAYSNFKLPMKISNRTVDSSELPHIATIEAFSSYLGKMNLLKKVVKFDFRE